MYAFAEVARRANKTCPVHCGQGGLVAYSEHRSSTIPFLHRDLRRVRSPFVEKFELHARAFGEADAENRSRAASPATRCRSLQALRILFGRENFAHGLRARR